MTDNREQLIAEAFTSLASGLAAPFDGVDLLHRLTLRCARVLDMDAVGVLLADGSGRLRVAAASSEQTRSLELFQVQGAEGPCLECYRTGDPVSVADLAAEVDRWPRLVPVAVAAGMASVHAIPMRLVDDVLGAVGLFGTRVGGLDDVSLNLGQALAEVAAVVFAAGNALDDREAVVDELQTVLRGRVAVEQAKGLLAQQGGMNMDAAFALLRQFSRSQGRRLVAVAHSVVERQLTAAGLMAHGVASEPTDGDGGDVGPAPHPGSAAGPG
jgi:hypothetical protein